MKRNYNETFLQRINIFKHLARVLTSPTEIREIEEKVQIKSYKWRPNNFALH